MARAGLDMCGRKIGGKAHWRDDPVGVHGQQAGKIGGPRLGRAQDRARRAKADHDGLARAHGKDLPQGRAHRGAHRPCGHMHRPVKTQNGMRQHRQGPRPPPGVAAQMQPAARVAVVDPDQDAIQRGIQMRRDPARVAVHALQRHLVEPPVHRDPERLQSRFRADHAGNDPAAQFGQPVQPRIEVEIALHIRQRAHRHRPVDQRHGHLARDLGAAQVSATLQPP